MDDGLNAWRWQELLWTLRWLAADADAALAAVPDVCVPDEIALDMDHWTQVARDWDLVNGPVLALLQEIDQEFEAMSTANRPDLWEEAALGTSPEWMAQRERAREVLALLGESRMDTDLGAPRPGGPVYVPAPRTGNRSQRTTDRPNP